MVGLLGAASGLAHVFLENGNALNASTDDAPSTKWRRDKVLLADTAESNGLIFITRSLMLLINTADVGINAT